MDEKNRKHTQEEISGRMNLMFGIFQKDAQISGLQSEKLQMMQDLYELEMKMYGRMSKIGKEVFEVEHCEIFNGWVRQMPESEWKESLDSSTASQQTDKGGSIHEKLIQYKIDAEKQKQQGNSPLKEGQKRETPELG